MSMVGGCHQVSWLYNSADNMIPYFLRKKMRENIHTQKKMKKSGYYSQKDVYPFTSKVQKLLHSFISAGSYNYVPKPGWSPSFRKG